MYDIQFEKRLKENAETIFGQGKKLPAGHRQRFELRLKEFNSGLTVKSTVKKRKAWKTLSLAIVSAAAILAGIVFLWNPFAENQPNTELIEVRNYYNMLLEEQAEATRQLIMQVDENQREILFSNVELIENEPTPEVQIPDDEYIILIASFYTNKIESLQNIQEIIRMNALCMN